MFVKMHFFSWNIRFSDKDNTNNFYDNHGHEFFIKKKINGECLKI